MATFEAKYRGRCGDDCGEDIEPGDEVVYIDDVLVHAECAPKTASLEAPERDSDPLGGWRLGDDTPQNEVQAGDSGRKEVVCQKCFLVHAGECY